MNNFVNRKHCLFLLLFFITSLLMPNTGKAAVPFTDIRSTHWAFESVDWAYNKKIISGYTNGTFGPKRTLTEAEFLVMLNRYNCLNDKGVVVKNADRHWAAQEYAYAKSKNLPLNGYTNFILREKPVTRGQVARIVAAFDGFDLNQAHAAQYMYVNQLSSGTTGIKNYADYAVDQPLTRAEAAVFVHRLAKRGQCSMIGLSNSATGKDDARFPLPAHFMPEGAVDFPKPNEDSDMPPSAPSEDSRLQSVNIEKETLIANGVDSTFITLTLKDCFGKPIPYEESMVFQASSSAGASISNQEYFDDYGEGDFLYATADSSTSVLSDGPDVTVKVTAPASTAVKSDKISFQVSSYESTNDKMACYRTPVTVDLSYMAKPELQVSVRSPTIAANGYATATVTAKIVQPGGQTITNYNGRVRFYSAKGALLSTSNVSFSNGQAAAQVTSLSSASPVEDTIYAELVQSDSRFSAWNRDIQSARHSTPVLYDPGLSVGSGCARDQLEVAFIIDSSSSMKQNDPERLRVSKSQQLLSTLNAPVNLASHFNGSGMLLSNRATAANVSGRLYGVFQSGGTNIAAGMTKAIKEFSLDERTKKVAILVTDGKSNEQQVLARVKEARDLGITLYTIGLGSETQLNEDLLQRVADETGGRYFHVEKSSDISTAYQTILNEVSCGELFLGCSPSGMVFTEPTLRMTNSTFYMDTMIEKACEEEVKRVVLRLHSINGHIDYELIDRGQNYYALKKDMTDINDYVYFDEGTFLAFDEAGVLIGKRVISINRNN